MAALHIEQFPAELHERLKHSASRHQRDVSEEALAILSAALAPERPAPVALPAVFQGRIPLTEEILEEALRESRR
jgi:plasmid stability protein